MNGKRAAELRRLARALAGSDKAKHWRPVYAQLKAHYRSLHDKGRARSAR